MAKLLNFVETRWWYSHFYGDSYTRNPVESRVFVIDDYDKQIFYYVYQETPYEWH